MARGRTWFWWHSCIGVTCGLMLFVICWSGTFAVLAHEIDWLLNPALRVAGEGARKPPDWARVVAAARAAVPDRPVTYLKLPPSPRDAAQAWAEGEEGGPTRIYVDPSTARVQGTTSFFNVQRFFRSFHMNLFFNTGPWGYLVVGAFSFPLLASIASALLFYKRWWKRFFSFPRAHGARATLAVLHRVGGLWSLAFGALIAATGFWYFIEAAGVEPEYPAAPTATATTAAAQRVPLGELLARSADLWPGLEVRAIHLPGGYLGEIVALEGQADAWLVRDRANQLFLDAATGREVARHRASDLGPAARWVDTADPLHFGDFAGLAGKLAWFAFGLLLCLLILSGTALHVLRVRARHGFDGMRAAIHGAHAATLLLLAAAAWGGGKEILGYGPLVQGVRHWPDVPAPVVAFIGAWIVVTVAILAAWMRFTSKLPEPGGQRR